MTDHEFLNLLSGIRFHSTSLYIFYHFLQGREFVDTVIIHRMSLGGELARLVPVTERKRGNPQYLRCLLDGKVDFSHINNLSMFSKVGKEGLQCVQLMALENSREYNVLYGGYVS